MGQKVNPIVFRLGINETWRSNWYAEKDYKKFLLQDFRIRELVRKKYKHASIDKVVIQRNGDKTKVQIFAAKSGVLIGKKGTEIETLKNVLKPFVHNELVIDVIEVKKPDLSATILAQGIATQLEKRVAFRRAMRRAIVSVQRAGGKGIKTQVSGRLAGADIARTERYTEGRLRLHTLRSAIDYAYEIAHTTYGTIGVKVWVYTGERFTYALPN